MLTLLAMLLAGCATSSKIVPVPKSAVDDAREKYPNADAVLLDDTETVVYELSSGSEPTATVTTTTAVLLLSDNGRERYGDASVFYRRGLSSVLEFSAQVTRPDGTVEKYSLSDASDMPAYQRWVLYSGSRILAMPFDPPQVGSIVQTRTVVHRQKAHLFSTGFGLGSSLVPSVRSTMKVCRPKTWRTKSLVLQQEVVVQHPSQETETDIHKCETWSSSNISPPEYETRGPRSSLQKSIQVQLVEWMVDGKKKNGFETPEALSDWEFKSHYDPMRQLTPEIEAQAEKIVQDVGDSPEAQAAALYAWVRDNVTYCAIQLGMGGWKPYPSTKVNDLRYGDCKDKATYLSALLKSRGISSRPAGIYHHKGFPRRFSFPVLGRFNHAILVVDLPGGPVVVDPTTRTVPFGRLPVGDEGATILPVSSPGSALMTTEIAAPEKHAEHLVFAGQLSATGKAVGNYRYKALGQPAWDYRYDLLTTPTGQWKDATERAIENVIFATIEHVAIEGAEPLALESSVIAKGELKFDIDLSGTGNLRFLRLSSIARAATPRIELPRKTPVLFRNRSKQVTQFVFQLPEGFVASYDANPIDLKTDFADYRLTVSVDSQDRLVFDREVTIRERLVSPAAAAAAHAFFEAIAKAENRAVVLRNSPKSKESR